jgi:ubiquinone/menaquinone biosynthesis C-methylase UbiE
MRKKRKFDSFDEFAKDYRDIHNDNISITGVDSEYFAEHKIQEIKKLEKNDQLQFLDFGCGDGVSSNFFLKYFSLSKYTGVDVSMNSILQARKKRPPQATFIHFNGIQLPFNEEQFDVIFVACVFHHIDFSLHNQVFSEILRVLKKGGRLYVFEHNPYNPLTRRIVNTCPFDKDAVLLKPKYLKNLLYRVGFGKVKIKYILFFPRHSVYSFFHQLERFLQKTPIGGQYFSISIKRFK